LSKALFDLGKHILKGGSLRSIRRRMVLRSRGRRPGHSDMGIRARRLRKCHARWEVGRNRPRKGRDVGDLPEKIPGSRSPLESRLHREPAPATLELEIPLLQFEREWFFRFEEFRW